MVMTLVLRLLPGPLSEGELVGQVEVVSTGEQSFVHSAQELLALAQQASGPASDEDR